MLNRALRLVRVYHNLSLVEAAQRLGISVGYLSDLERKKGRAPSLKVLQKYADSFGLPLSALLLFDEQVKSSQDEGSRVYIGGKALRILEWIDELTADKREDG